MRFLFVFGLIGMLAVAAPAHAQGGQPGQIVFDVPPPPRSAADAELFERDSKVVDRAMQARSVAELAPMETELAAVVEHVPAQFRLYQQRPERIVVRADREAGAVIAKAMANAMIEADPKALVYVSYEKNVYGFAGLALASVRMERKDYPGAIRTLDQTASFQPDNPKVMSARARAMAAAGRLPDAIAVLLAWRRDFKLQAELSPLDTAMILRDIGYVMTEQKRFADATDYYQQSLKLDPKNKTARDELKRIAQLSKAK